MHLLYCDLVTYDQLTNVVYSCRLTDIHLDKSLFDLVIGVNQNTGNTIYRQVERKYYLMVTSGGKLVPINADNLVHGSVNDIKTTFHLTYNG